MQTVIGADPELFLADATGKFISAIGKIGGTKENPKPVEELGAGFAVQEDNVAVEYNIPPCKSEALFLFNNHKMLNYLNKMVGEQYGLKLAAVPSVSFTDDQLQDYGAHIFGCDPDYNAWTLKANARPECDDLNLRSSGGHVHVECPKFTKSQRVCLIRHLDFYLGSTLSFYDKDEKRRLLYGKAGAFRFKPYGVEYRTPSNFWLTKDKFMSMVYRAVEYSLSAVLNGNEVSKETQKIILRAINENDTNSKNLLLEMNGFYVEN